MARFKVALGRNGCTVSMRVLDMQEGMRGTGWMNLASPLLVASVEGPSLSEIGVYLWGTDWGRDRDTATIEFATEKAAEEYRVRATEALLAAGGEVVQFASFWKDEQLKLQVKSEATADDYSVKVPARQRPLTDVIRDTVNRLHAANGRLLEVNERLETAWHRLTGSSIADTPMAKNGPETTTESADVPALEECLGRIDRVTERLALVVGVFVGSE